MSSRIVVAACLILASVTGHPATVVSTLDFDGAAGTLTTYIEDGYIFEDLSATGGLVSFSAGKLRLTGPDPDDAFIRLKRVDGGLFSLVSMDVQEIIDVGPRLLVSGFGNGTSQITGTFLPFVPPLGTFVGISGMTFLADGRGVDAEYLLDNIVLSAEVAVVPLPPALPLMALALAGIGYSRRKVDSIHLTANTAAPISHGMANGRSLSAAC